GRGIAAHLAGCGIDVLLLDIVPPGEQSSDPAKRNAFAAGGLDKAIKNKPALFYDAADARRVTVGNLEDDLDALAGVDWVVEAVVERLDIKRALFERLDAVLKPGTVISSNTSGLPLADLVEGRSDAFRSHFIITHFFNPVRYMKLLEVVQGPDTEPTLLPRFEIFARQTLGKGIVHAKDSPAFVANRIGTFSMMYSVHRMVELGMSPEALDAIFSQPMGRAKSGIFRTADVVGLDTLAFVSTHLYEDLPGDALRDYFKIPDFLQDLLNKGFLGSKSKKGVYQKVGKDFFTFDPYTRDYRAQDKPRFASVGAARKIEDTGRRIKAMISGDDEAAKLAWECLAQTLAYAARHINDIATDLVQIDNGMKWGFAQEMGPFETWDAIGVAESVARMKADGIDVPGWVDDMLAAGRTSFYEGLPGERTYWDDATKAAAPEVISPRFRRLPETTDHPSLVSKNRGARLWDIGDGVLCVEFRTKMNAVDADITAMLGEAVERAEADFDAVILGNHAPAAFSAGANIMLIAMGAQQKQWDGIRSQIQGFQQACAGLRAARVPVVAAPFGLTLGGGAEMCLGASAIQAHAELYMGLVEVGVGLIPGGGGTFALLHNLQAGSPDADPLSHLRAAFLAIGMAKVGTSAEESRKIGFLRANDRVTMDRDELLEAAKWRALGMARSDHKAVTGRRVKVAGRSGYGTIYANLWDMAQTGQISEHDQKIGAKLAYVLSGGDVAADTWVSEERFHELEQEAFLSLCGEEKTLARIQYMLMNNKPLRN
ncbi:MAG: 3-hydroxyacyl-CoA dehydrogenase/enoyl-CoA hydratase family protein, partial [Myxococcales bacterium]|nr:3-hydroxyacyl-CoA dehydrogenase/enoyl-CoA hydratase family protein [Myxococcales bacterium]